MVEPLQLGFYEQLDCCEVLSNFISDLDKEGLLGVEPFFLLPHPDDGDFRWLAMQVIERLVEIVDRHRRRKLVAVTAAGTKSGLDSQPKPL